MVSEGHEKYTEEFDYSKVIEKSGDIANYLMKIKGYWKMAKVLNQIFSNK